MTYRQHINNLKHHIGRYQKMCNIARKNNNTDKVNQYEKILELLTQELEAMRGI